MNRELHDFKVLAITPFETPDSKLSIELIRTGALAFLDIGRDWQTAKDAITLINNNVHKPFGIRIPEGVIIDKNSIAKIDHIKHILHASPTAFRPIEGYTNIIQVVSLEEVIEAEKLGADALIIKGNESGGRVGNLPTFIFLQKIKNSCKLPYWVQGGVGPHTASMAVYAGANGVVYDSQLALMGKYARDPKIKKIIESFNGSETEVVEGYKYLKHGLMGTLQGVETKHELFEKLSATDDDTYLAGNDIVLASIFKTTYADVKTLVYLTEEAIIGNITLAKQNPTIHKNTEFCKSMGIEYPIIQGPMTRVSDEPEFAYQVAKNGALPSVALAVLKPDRIKAILTTITKRIPSKPWAAGLLGFIPPNLLNEQIKVLLEHKPSVVIIAGGRPDQFHFFKKNNIPSFIHCPSYPLLKQFLKEKVNGFIFEGRECGGHIGPLSSCTLWESQITTLLNEDKIDNPRSCCARSRVDRAEFPGLSESLPPPCQESQQRPQE